jgi:small nuclear ribonucleoprotein (snRNP)-like protein
MLSYINSDPTAATQDTELVKQMKNMMGRNLRCHLSDGRIITGSFDCVDKHRNIILDRASEIKSLDEPDTKRSIGYVLIPGEHLIKCEVQDD